MSENDFELRGIAWSKAFPFVRLFRTFTLARDMRQLTLALLCVGICWGAGYLLDWVWLSADSGVLTAPQAGATKTEIEAYAATRIRAEVYGVPRERPFDEWKRGAEQDYRRQQIAAVVRWTAVEGPEDAEALLASNSVRSLVETGEYEQQVGEVRGLIDEQLEKRLAAIDGNEEMPAAEREDRKETLRRQADYLRLILAGRDAAGFVNPSEAAAALEAFVDRDLEPGEQAEQQALIREVVDRERMLAEIEQREPVGPFAALLDYQMRCLSAAIQGICTGHWGFSGGALDAEPAMLGSVASAGKGILWLITQKPGYAIIYGIVLLVVFSFFGGAICRSAAIRIAREESIELRAALRFAREKFSGLLLAPVLPLAIIVVGAVVVWIGGFIGGLIPVVGELLTGVLYGLALLAGFGLGLVLLGTVLGFNLLWPTIGAEGSDAFDAVQHALGYVGQRPWYAGFYGFVLLLSGGVCFVMVRLIVLLMFKVTHVISGAGLGLFGVWSSARTETFGKLDAMWHMPAWSELPLLPTAGGVPLWGTFSNAPLSGSETVATFLIACWVFLCVALVGAFLVSFYFSGSTQMYLLLRHHVDAVDLDEIYYEEEEEPQEPVGEEPAVAPAEPEDQESPPPAGDEEAPESPPSP